ncbi:MAG: tetratricopeptide repeat protein [Verrucomicrobia bacterium]|nr:tetratricopeptide repeat protein [Verrucomicrobiota bacterium]
MANPGLANSGDADFHQEEAIRLASAGKLAEAIGHFETAARLRPDNPIWHFNCGLAWQQLNQLPNAIAAYQAALSRKPDFFDAWSNLCAALKASGEFQAAVDAGRKAAALRPDSAGAHLHLGNALKAQGDWAAAEASYRVARGLEPGTVRIQLNLANTLREMGRLPEAIALLREAVAKSPRFAEAHRDLAFALLLSGGLRAGWEENEWRWQTEELAPKRRSFPQPAWARENLAGRRLFVYTEQGFGDAIQFVRYIELLIERGAEIILECQIELRRLFRMIPSVARLLTRGEAAPPFDFHAPLMSLPRLVGTTLETIPRRVPYLKVPPELANEASLPRNGRLKVGLIWAGNPSHLNDRNRSLPVELLRPLLDVEGVDFYSLQIGERARDAQQGDITSRITDVRERISDFASTAAIVDQLDLVISVDTATAHLAGALARPTWLLLPFAPDWRWLLGRDDSVWYPTMRLFRQPGPGNWTDVVARVCAQLRASVVRGER